MPPRPDSARAVAFDPRAPASERFDAESEMQATHRPSGSQAMAQAVAMGPVIEMIRQNYAEADMLKAAGPGMIIPMPGRERRATPSRGMSSVFLDQQQIFITGDVYEKPSPLDFDALRDMCRQTPVLAAVVKTRQRQISRFTQVSEDGGLGFEIRHRDRKHKLDETEEHAAKLLSRFVANCGWEENARARKRLRRDTFSQFMAKSVEDSLTMDACPIETEFKRDRRLGIDGFYAVDGTTVRLCTDAGYEGDDEIFALQMLHGTVQSAYTHDDLIYEVRNPSTDVRRGGYGQGEGELLIRTVTGFLNAMTYNITGFDQNSIPKGMLQLIGDYGQEDLIAFRRYWNMQLKGASSQWALPILSASDPQSKAEFTKFGIEFNEMMFAKWMTFLTAIICSIYGIAPEEINFESFSAQKSSLSGSDTGEKLASSKDLGLRPLMAFYEALVSDFLISEFDPKFCFRWIGLDQDDPAALWDRQKTLLTLDEARAENGYQPHPDEKVGALPMNPSLIGPAMQLNQPAQPGQEFGGPAPAEGGDFGTPDDEAGAGEAAPGDPDEPDPTGPDPGQPTEQAGPDFGKAMIYALA